MSLERRPRAMPVDLNQQQQSSSPDKQAGKIVNVIEHINSNATGTNLAVHVGPQEWA
jgi:hypothetical protein